MKAEIRVCIPEERFGRFFASFAVPVEEAESIEAQFLAIVLGWAEPIEL